MRFKRAALAAAITAAVIPAAGAQASTAGLEGTTLNVVAGAGERNTVSIGEASGGVLVVRDVAGLRARAGCEQVSSIEARCGGVRVDVALGDGIDAFVAQTDAQVTVDGGIGDDAYVHNAATFTRVDFSGGAGRDEASYANADRGVIVSKDAAANDGRAGVDRDNVRADVEKLTGSRFNDSLNGSNELVLEEFVSGAGDDVVSGNNGPDRFLMGSVDDGSDRILGGSGADTADYSQRSRNLTVRVDSNGADDGEAGEGDEIRDIEALHGGNGNDNLENTSPDNGPVLITGRNGNDRLVGGRENDELHGDVGSDLVFGQDGHDTITFFDSVTGDVAQCGDGIDTVDRGNNQARLIECERDHPIGRPSLSSRVVKPVAGKPSHVRLSWTHPQAWRKLRTLTLRLELEGAEAGSVVIRPRSGDVKVTGGVRRAKGKLTTRGRTASVKLALRLDPSLDGAKLRAEVEATDFAGRRQIG